MLSSTLFFTKDIPNKKIKRVGVGVFVLGWVGGGLVIYFDKINQFYIFDKINQFYIGKFYKPLLKFSKN